MAETRSKTQFPMGEVAGTVPGTQEGVQAFQRGLEMGREAAQTAVRKIGAWAEENPGQVVLAGLAAGFILGKLLLGRRRPALEDIE